VFLCRNSEIAALIYLVRAKWRKNIVAEKSVGTKGQFLRWAQRTPAAEADLNRMLSMLAHFVVLPATAHMSKLASTPESQIFPEGREPGLAQGKHTFLTIASLSGSRGSFPATDNRLSIFRCDLGLLLCSRNLSPQLRQRR